MIETYNIEVEINSLTKKREKYARYTAKDRYNIVNYGSKNGNIASLRKFKIKFPNFTLLCRNMNMNFQIQNEKEEFHRYWLLIARVTCRFYLVRLM